MPSLPADTRWRPWAAVSLQSLKAVRADHLFVGKVDCFLSSLLSHARMESPGSPDAEWDELWNGGECVPSQFFPAKGFCEHSCSGSIENFAVLGCGWVVRSI